jgi:hypothetical protein
VDAFFEWPWRFYPATAIALAGLLLVVRGARRQAAARRYSESTMSKPIYMMVGFRMLLLGAPLVLAALGWVFQQEWLFWIGIIVAGEETLETSMLLAALHEGERALALAARRRSRPAAADTTVA